MQNENILQFNDYAKSFNEAMPLGNGHIGGMVYFNPQCEKIGLNEGTFWSGFPKKFKNDRAKESFYEVKKLFETNELLKAQNLMENQMMGNNTASFLPVGDLLIYFKNDNYSDYQRSLDLENAVATCSYVENENKIEKSSFISFKDKVLVYKISAQKEIELRLDFVSKLRHELQFTSDGLKVKGTAPKDVLYYHIVTDEPNVYHENVEENGMRFFIKVAVKTDGKINNGIISGKDITIILSLTTSYNGCEKHPYIDGKNEIELGNDIIGKALKIEYEKLLNNHKKDFSAIFNRVSLKIESKNKETLVTRRLNNLRNGEKDSSFCALVFNFGRYLFISSSRENSMAINLQGLWNKESQPYWRSNYTTNINLQMNYWAIDNCNMSDLFGSFVNLLQNVAKNGEEVAENYFGLDGWCCNHNLDIWANPVPAGENGKGWEGSACCLYFPLAGCWLVDNLYKHYEFTEDEKYLRETCLPIMLGAVKFVLGYMTLKNGRYEIIPSVSPENKYLMEDGSVCAIDISTTVDTNIVFNLFQKTINALEITEPDSPLIDKLKDAISKLRPLEIGTEKELKEWNTAFCEKDKGHRHLSHLTALYPFDRINKTLNSEFLGAAEKSLERRMANGGGGTGWSLGWLLNLYARLGDNKNAEKILNRFITTSVYDNLFDLHPPLSKDAKDVFQIDGNFGITAGIAEMLLQSNNGYIELLPCLPKSWENGEVKGLKARGNVTVGIVWKNGKLKSATFEAAKPKSVAVVYKDKKILLDFTLRKLQIAITGFEK